MSDCPRGEMRDLLPELLHDGLDGVRRTAIEAHVASCADCSAELALLRSARAVMLRQTPALDAERIGRTLRKERSTSVAHRRHWSFAHPVARVVLPAAAALLLVLVGTFAFWSATADRPVGGVRIAEQARPAETTVPAPGEVELDPAQPPRATGATAQGTEGTGLLVAALADLDEEELVSLLQLLPVLDPYPDEDPPLMLQGFSNGGG